MSVSRYLSNPVTTFDLSSASWRASRALEAIDVYTLVSWVDASEVARAHHGQRVRFEDCNLILPFLRNQDQDRQLLRREDERGSSRCPQ